MSKPKSKKFLKIALPIVTVAGFSGLIIGLSGAFVSVATISIGGSSAVLPLISAYANQYSAADIITSGGGSGVGINSIIDGTKEIGMASKDPGIEKLDPNNPKYKIWKEKQVKTIAVAYDAIAIVYKPSSPSTELTITYDNIFKIYKAFSGIEKVSFGDLTNDPSDKTIIIPYARNGGAAISGTADGFLNSSYDKFWDKFDPNSEKDEKEKVKNILENGDYGSNVIQTAESNSQAWNRAKDGGCGSMVYLSAGFVLNNLETIKASGFKVAKYNPFDPSNQENPNKSKAEDFELTRENIKNGYNWYRPFNLIYSIKQIENNQNIINALSWMLFDKETQTICESEGFVFPTDKDKEEMGWNEKNADDKTSFLTQKPDIPQDS